MGSTYIEEVIKPHVQKELVRECVNRIKENFSNIDAIVVTGLSGLIIGSTVSMKTGKQLVVVRKPRDESHASTNVEGLTNLHYPFKYVILDDFIDSGKTLRRIVQQMGKSPKCLGYLLYNQGYKAAKKNLPFREAKQVFFRL
jgi:adenine/guanine phosphoribosyltransferase-like PRPP-binding protein